MRYLLAILLLLPTTVFAQNARPPIASQVRTDASGWDGNLAPTDTDVQKALQKFDDFLGYDDSDAQSATGWTRSGTTVKLTNSGDNVGIGSSAPQQKLEVVGSIKVGTTTISGASITDTTGQVSFDNDILYTTGNVFGNSFYGLTGLQLYNPGGATDPGITMIDPTNTNSLQVSVEDDISFMRSGQEFHFFSWENRFNFQQADYGSYLSIDLEPTQAKITSSRKHIYFVDANLYTLGNIGIGTSEASTRLAVMGGNVGIGTSAPKATLDVRATDSAISIDEISSGLFIGGCDADTTLLLHMDGTDEAQVFVDENCSGSGVKTWTANGNINTEVSTLKFGTASAELDGNGDYISINYAASGDGLAFGSGAFTIDFWWNPSSVTTTQAFWAVFDGANYLLRFRFDSTGKLTILCFNTSGTEIARYTTTNSLGLSNGAWVHIAFVRSGSTFYMFKNGTSLPVTVTTNLGSGSFGEPNVGKYIGYTGDGSAPQNVSGYLDEFRVSKGIARWTSDFSVATQAYDTGGSSYTPSLKFYADGTQTAVINTDGTNSNALNIGVASTSRITINSSGNVGIGTTAPLGHLVVGADKFAVLSSGNVGIADITPDAPLEVVGDQMWSATAAGDGDRMIMKAGNLGIGSTAPREKLDVAGNIYATSTGTFGGGTNAVQLTIKGNVAQTQSTALVSIADSSGTELGGIYNPRSVYNSFWGYRAGKSINTSGGSNGLYNTFLGSQAGENVTTGNNNVFVGLQAGIYNASAVGNTAVGSQAGVGQNGFSGGQFNTFLGNLAGNKIKTGRDNTGIGYSALKSITTGGYNTFIGSSSGLNVTEGSYNSGFGYNVMPAVTTGQTNVGNGYDTMRFLQDGSNNVAVGYNAMYSNISGNNNTSVGYRAGYTNLNSGSVFLGNYAGYYETGANTLIVDNAQRSNESDARVKALLYGIFSSTISGQSLLVNGSLTSQNLTIGTGVAGTDYTLTFNGETNDGVITWMEDENSFWLDKGIYTTSGNVGIGTTAPVQPLDVDGNVYIHNGHNVGIGTSVPRAGLEVATEIYLGGTAADAAGSILCKKTDGTVGTCGTLLGVICTVCN